MWCSVLFELLAGHENMDSVTPINEMRPDDPAELYALWEVRGASEADASATVPERITVPCSARLVHLSERVGKTSEDAL